MGLDLYHQNIVTTLDLGLFDILIREMKSLFSTKYDSKKISRLALYALLIFVAYSIADLGLIYFRDLMLPNQAPPKKISIEKAPNYVNRSQYNSITSRNIFASSGVIPEPLFAGNTTKKNDNDPIPSQLPLGVVGTLVHSNPQKSIAAIELKSKKTSSSYSVGADIENLAVVEKIERNRVIIRNNTTGVLEYIEMKNANSVSFAEASSSVTSKNDVVNLGNNTFTIKRADLLKYTNDLSGVLMQARAVPNRDPNTGEINGFRVLDMQPGSIYEQLGLQRMDVIKGVNNEPVDSIQKAMEMYNTLKNGSQVKMQVERQGKTETFTYNIN